MLVYYAITNLCAIRLKDEERLYPVWISYVGFIACLSLALFADWRVTSLAWTYYFWINMEKVFSLSHLSLIIVPHNKPKSNLSKVAERVIRSP